MLKKYKNILDKYTEYFITKIKVHLQQQTFLYNGVNLKYMYRSAKDSDELVVVFSACTREGLQARYNYVKTLQHMHCNQLFLLDDFGEDKRGSFYLGKSPEFMELEASIRLIERTKKKKNLKKIIFCGSCKGGFATLNIGCRFQDSIMIVGEPIYHIATEFRRAEALLRYWMGDVTEEKIHKFDLYLSNLLKNNPYKNTQKIYFFYSDQDEYYEKHTKLLIDDFNKYGYQVESEIAHFKLHADLGIWFREYIKKQIGAILKQWKT